MEKINCVVIGSGVVGLAVAEKLARNRQEIILLEKNGSFGKETSSRNSEVIHAAIYYPKGSLKSELCLKGNKMLYAYCAANGVKHQRCGKLIVSTNQSETEEIETIFRNARQIEVPELELLDAKRISRMETNIFALNAIYSGSTGIIDSHALMKSLHKKGMERGIMYSFNNQVTAIKKENGGYLLQTSNGDEILAEKVINCAGLNADKVAALVGIEDYRLFPCKGDYFSVARGKGKVKHLIYPVPHAKRYGLGIHATLDLTGHLRLGPDANYVSAISYDIDPGKAHAFYEAARTYLPWLEENMLSPDTSGIRPKLQGPSDDFRDFIIRDEADKGFPGFINLIGIESPGLTASLAIGEYVSNLLRE